MTVFEDSIEALPPREFLAHFLSDRGVVAPHLPPPTPAALANARQVLDNCFDLVGERYVLPDGFSWKLNPSRDTEWQIAHHKFPFAVDLVHAYRQEQHPAYLEKWMELLDTWLDEMGSGFITASDAQVEAKRVEHWVLSFLLLRGTACQEIIPPAFLRRFLERIATETEYITQHLKPVRNHRTFQLWTVFLVGVVFPEFRQHRVFLESGRDLLSVNMLTDFLPDGVHVELSTHYHQLAFETGLAFLELAGRNGIRLDPALGERLAQAARFSMFMQWPNGSIPLVNDSDNGDHRDLLERASRLFGDPRLLWAATLGHQGEPPRERAAHFDSSGYVVLSDGWGQDPESYARRQHVFYDCAQLGEGSHSHYDLFSFCYFANGRPVVVDPGRYTYSPQLDADGIDWRRVFKSTASHNTVTIDGRDQTRYISKLHPRQPGAPKHGPAVQIEDRDLRLGERTDWIRGTAQSVEYTPRHQRLFVYVNRQYLLIVDHVLIDDGQRHEAALRFHLPDDCLGQVTLEKGETDIVARTPWAEIRSARVDGLQACLEPGWVSTTYGVKTPAPVVTFTQSSATSMVFCSTVAPLAADAAGLVVQGCRLMESPADGVVLLRVDGVLYGSGFSDWLLFPCGPTLEAVQLEDVVFRGRFLLWRRSGERDQVVHIVAARAEQLAFTDGPRLAHAPGEHIEWSAPAWT